MSLSFTWADRSKQTQFWSLANANGRPTNLLVRLAGRQAGWCWPAAAFSLHLSARDTPMMG